MHYFAPRTELYFAMAYVVFYNGLGCILHQIWVFLLIFYALIQINTIYGKLNT